MSLPKIEISSLYRHNLMSVNIEKNKMKIVDVEIYMPSEISHIIAKLMFDSSVYGEISRLLKIFCAQKAKMVQIILLENLSNEELMMHKQCAFEQYMETENFLALNFVSSSSWLSCGIEEFLTIPLKSLTILGAELIGESLRRLTPHVLLSTPSEMFWDEVPSPQRLVGNNCDQYVFSQSQYACPDNDPGHMLALDCEMVSTGNVSDLALARVSVVRCAGDCDLTTAKGVKEWLALGAPFEVVYDEYVRPRGVVVDYLTKFSGITDKTLEHVTTTLDDVHAVLNRLITPSTILVGHSIQMDLKALRLYHPYIIDTSTIYNTKGDINLKPSLFSLSKDILKQEIRNKKKGCGHDSVEDAHAALRLTMVKLLKDMNFGNMARLTNNPKTTNTLAGEWRDVSGAEDNKEDNKRRKPGSVEMCVIDFGGEDTDESERRRRNDDGQRRRDRFTLLSAHPAVAKIPALMYATNKALELIVNVNGVIGRCQDRDRRCGCVYRELSDGEVVLRTMTRCKETDLVISVLSDYGGVCSATDSEEERLSLCQTQLVALQHNVAKIVGAVPTRSVIMVICPGQDRSDSTGKLFWKIK